MQSLGLLNSPPVSPLFLFFSIALSCPPFPSLLLFPSRRPAPPSTQYFSGFKTEPQMNRNLKRISSRPLFFSAFFLPSPFCFTPTSPTHTHPFALAVTARGLIAGPKGRSCGGFMMKRRREREGGGDQSNAFKLLIISIKALQDINPVRRFMCVGEVGGGWGEA